MRGRIITMAVAVLFCSICREIALKMGGKIYLDTSYSPGARFVFAVPL